MNEFYMTLHSDQNSIKGMENTTSSFKVYLGHEMLLPGKWVVGLAEIYYPLTMKIMTEEDATITVENLHPKTGRVLSVKRVILSTDRKGIVGLDSKLFFLLLRDALIHVDIDVRLEDDVRFQMFAEPNTKKIILSEKMRIVLGLNERSYILNPMIKAVQGFNVKRVLPQQILISTDLINHQLVGGTYDQILRSIHLDAEKYCYGCMGHTRFETIQYYEVGHQKIDDIGIYIKDRFGDFVSFSNGTLSVILHFKKIQDV